MLNIKYSLHSLNNLLLIPPNFRILHIGCDTLENSTQRPYICIGLANDEANWAGNWRRYGSSLQGGMPDPQDLERVRIALVPTDSPDPFDYYAYLDYNTNNQTIQALGMLELRKRKYAAYGIFDISETTQTAIEAGGRTLPTNTVNESNLIRNIL
jgi:hypothetical protein